MMTQEIIAIDLLFKRGVGDVAEPDFVALQDDMRVGETIKIMREKDVPSILVLECVSAARAGAITAAGDLDQLSHHSIIFKKKQQSSRAAAAGGHIDRKRYTLSHDGGRQRTL